MADPKKLLWTSDFEELFLDLVEEADDFLDLEGCSSVR